MKIKSKLHGYQQAKKVYCCKYCHTAHSPKKPSVCERCGQQDFWKFDSKTEFKHFCTLVLLLKTKQITDLKVQVPYQLELTGQYGKFKRKYIADFVYTENSGKKIVEDVKGNKKGVSDIFKIKKELMRVCHGIEVKEVYL